MTGKIDNQIVSLQVIMNKWYTTSNKVVESTTPPLEGINIPIAGTIIKASHFKEKSDKPASFVTSADIDRVVEQNNYSNQILHTISKQIEDSKPSISRRPTPSSISSSQIIEPNPWFKLNVFSWQKFPKIKETFEISGNVLDKIDEQLSNFNNSTKDGKTQNKISTLQGKTTLLHRPTNDHFHNRKNYHSRSSFPDLQYEENAFMSTSSQEGRDFIEWNIYGLAEHQSYNKLHEIRVGSFCQDFSFITPPVRVKKDKNPKKSHLIKSQRDSTKPSRKKSRSKRPRDSKLDVCWTCGKSGH
ncbi:hypothetical protein H5410_028078 [Solanum commersonii]|uniref:CCHC-type domain-containing protein n=1 Tax=Solanum commersonii TaxID=4109 RepID=A0A9J5Z1M6_SOLCO|nr:hypothetical protein H5410_028078 [Solanum commersonii]